MPGCIISFTVHPLSFSRSPIQRKGSWQKTKGQDVDKSRKVSILSGFLTCVRLVMCLNEQGLRLLVKKMIETGEADNDITGSLVIVCWDQSTMSGNLCG